MTVEMKLRASNGLLTISGRRMITRYSLLICFGEFFYDKGKEYLAHDIRSILDYYNRAGNQRLDSDQNEF